MTAAALAALRKARAALDEAEAALQAKPDPLPPIQPPPLPPPAATQWREVWTEPWQQLLVGGWTRIEAKTAPPESLDDPGVGAWSGFGVPVGGWSMVGDRTHLDASAGLLRVRSPQHLGRGLYLLSQRRFDKGRPIHATAAVELLPAPGAWVGLTLYCGEGNYREIGLAWMSGNLVATLHTPRYFEALSGPLTPGGRRLAIEYLPDAGWRLLLDEAVIYREAIGYRGNALQADPVVGLFAVNLDVEARRLEAGRVDANIGPVVVYQGP